MVQCQNCDATHDGSRCPWCDYRREELLERLRPDSGAVEFVTLVGWAQNGVEEVPERCWEVR